VRIFYQQPGANIIETVDGSRRSLPLLQGVDRSEDRSGRDLRPLGHDPRLAARGRATLVLAVALVILVVYMFLRSRATLIPAVVVPVSLIGTFGAMYLLATASTISR
jgi:multidrug efflux pump